MKKYNIQNCQELASQQGGECLSQEYVASNKKLIWKCGKGHTWKATFTQMKLGTWCRKCMVITKRRTIEDCNSLANVKNGRCLSTVYENNLQKLVWMCEKKHIWKQRYNNVQQGNWCPYCAGKIITIEDCYDLAKEKKGECLSTSYKNDREHLTWRCSVGHEWRTSYHAVRSGTWCNHKDCINKRTKNTFMKKYGVVHNMMDVKVQQKAARSMNNSYIKQHWFSNEELVCVGSYEKAVVEFFNKNKVDYNWQVKTFLMSDERTYTPDCYIPDQDLWIEIKGYFRKDAKEKWDWFHKNYPNSELWDKKKLKEMRIL